MKFVKWIFLAFALIFNCAGAAYAQTETESIQTRNKFGVVEEYSVLRRDKSVRQGSYVRYHPAGPLAGLAVYEAGAYERGLKEGEWRCFFEQYPWNELRSKGNYHAGLPEGLWIYYYPDYSGSNSKKVVPMANSKGAKSGFIINVDDTAAVVQAKGLCYKGAKIGVWKYYSATGQLIQAINHSINHLMYWQPATGAPVSGETVAANHPLLYVGGKERLRLDISMGLDLHALVNAGQVGSAVFRFSVDSASHQTHVALAENMLPNKYETLIIHTLNNMTTQWLAQVVDGHPVAASYQVRIITTLKERGIWATIEPLGD